MTSLSTSRHPDDDGPHVRVSVFAGPDREHRAHVGVLTFRRGEDNEFIYRVEDRYAIAALERISTVLEHARTVSPSERQTVYVADVQAALDGDQAHVGPRKRGQRDTTDPEGPA